MANDQSHITVTISPEAITRLRELAQRWNFVTQSGRMAGQGNVSGLLEAVGMGALRIYRRPLTSQELLAMQQRRLAEALASPEPDDLEIEWVRSLARYAEKKAALEQKQAGLEQSSPEVVLARVRLDLEYDEARVRYWEAKATRQLPLPEGDE